jgi:hypothetical protein
MATRINVQVLQNQFAACPAEAVRLMSSLPGGQRMSISIAFFRLLNGSPDSSIFVLSELAKGGDAQFMLALAGSVSPPIDCSPFISSLLFAWMEGHGSVEDVRALGKIKRLDLISVGKIVSCLPKLALPLAISLIQSRRDVAGSLGQGEWVGFFQRISKLPMSKGDLFFLCGTFHVPPPIAPFVLQALAPAHPGNILTGLAVAMKAHVPSLKLASLPKGVAVVHVCEPTSLNLARKLLRDTSLVGLDQVQVYALFSYIGCVIPPRGWENLLS